MSADTIKKYVGQLKTFSRHATTSSLGLRVSVFHVVRLLDCEGRFAEDRQGAVVLNFTGCPFNSQKVEATLKRDKRYKIRLGASPRKRAAELMWEDNHLAIHASFWTRRPSPHMQQAVKQHQHRNAFRYTEALATLQRLCHVLVMLLYIQVTSYNRHHTLRHTCPCPVAAMPRSMTCLAR